MSLGPDFARRFIIDRPALLHSIVVHDLITPIEETLVPGDTDRGRDLLVDTQMEGTLVMWSVMEYLLIVLQAGRTGSSPVPGNFV